jgi:hypothetical protein
MANLLHRLLRPRAGEEAEPGEAAQPEPIVGPEPELAAEAGETEAPSAAAKPKPAGKGPRKTRDEVSTIGPGEP